MRIIVNLINLSSSVLLGGDILEQVWTWKDIPYRHLRVFSCKVFVHSRRDKNPNLIVK